MFGGGEKNSLSKINSKSNSKSTQTLTVIPLGGLGEFGMNMMVFRYGEDILVVDAGMMFPESELLGVDLVIPDITYLKQNQEHVKAIVLTHGHEDHIGALPYILRDLNVPIYGTRFTLALVKKRLAEAGLLESAKLFEVTPGRMVEIGPYEIEFIPVTHSTVDCVALAIRTPIGVIIHTGDFKIDQTPVDGAPFDLHAFARYGNEGVLALFSDSTNVERPGFTPSERVVVPRIEELTRQAPRRVVLSCFASSIHRIQQVIDIAGARWAQSRVRRAQHGGQRGDCARSGIVAHTGRDGGAAAGYSGIRSEAIAAAGERIAGGTDVVYVADRGGQSPAGDHRRERHGDFERADYSGK